MKFDIDFESLQRSAFLATLALHLIATIMVFRAWRKYGHLFLLWIALSQFLWIGSGMGIRFLIAFSGGRNSTSPILLITFAMGLAGTCFLFYGFILLIGFLKSLDAPHAGSKFLDRTDSGYRPKS